MAKFNYTLAQWIAEYSKGTAQIFHPTAYAKDKEDAIAKTEKLIKAQVLGLMVGSTDNNYKRLKKDVACLSVVEAHRIYKTLKVPIAENIDSINFSVVVEELPTLAD